MGHACEINGHPEGCKWYGFEDGIVPSPDLDPFLNSSLDSGFDFDLEPVLLVQDPISIKKFIYGSRST